MNILLKLGVHLRGLKRLVVMIILAIAVVLGFREALTAPESEISRAMDLTLSPERERGLGQVAEIAARIETETGFPAEVLVAQWAVESDWGERPACKENYFGIKHAPRHQKGCRAKTTEVYSAHQVEMWTTAHPNGPPLKKEPDGHNGFIVHTTQEFADYESLEESCRDYVWLITNVPAYAAAWRGYQKSHDPDALLKALAGIYWTDPEYVGKVHGVIAQEDVKESLALARGETLPSVPDVPRPWRPLTQVGFVILLANAGLLIAVSFARARSRARHEEFKTRVDGIRTGLEAKLTDALAKNNADLKDEFNGRYLQTKRFEQAHEEMRNDLATAVSLLRAAVSGAGVSAGIRVASAPRT